MTSEKRRARDGNAYSRAEFVDHYGNDVGAWHWANATLASVTVAEAHAPDSNAPMPLSVPATEHDQVAAATEHSAAIVGDQLHASNADTSEEPADILTVEEAENIRRATLNRQQIHSQMRQILDSVRRGEALRQPDILVRNAPAQTP